LEGILSAEGKPRLGKCDCTPGHGHAADCSSGMVWCRSQRCFPRSHS